MQINAVPSEHFGDLKFYHTEDLKNTECFENIEF